MFSRGLSKKGTVSQPRLQRLSDPELVMAAEACLFQIGRAITHLKEDGLRSAQQELQTLDSALTILLSRHS